MFHKWGRCCGWLSLLGTRPFKLRFHYNSLDVLKQCLHRSLPRLLALEYLTSGKKFGLLAIATTRQESGMLCQQMLKAEPPLDHFSESKLSEEHPYHGV